MPKLTLVYSAALILLGLIGYFGTGGPGEASITALIPAFAGVLFLLCGLLALKENLRMHAMHVAALLALLAIIGTADGIIGTGRLIAGVEVERPVAAISKGLMSLFSIIYLGLSIRSFVVARILKKNNAST